MRRFLWPLLIAVMILVLAAGVFVLLLGSSSPNARSKPPTPSEEPPSFPGPAERSRILDEPPPPLQVIDPEWPQPEIVAATPKVRLPAPDLDLVEPTETGIEGLLEPPPATVPGSKTLMGDPDARFANHLLSLRSKGLELTVIVDGGVATEATFLHILAATDLIRVLFPRARIGAVLYNTSSSRSAALGATSKVIHDVLSTDEGRRTEIAEVMGLARAMRLAAEYPWTPEHRSVILLIAGTQPWIGELPGILKTVRRFRRRNEAEVRLIEMPGARPAEGLSGFDRLASGGDVLRTVVGKTEALEQEILSVIVGADHNDDLQRLSRDFRH